LIRLPIHKEMHNAILLISCVDQKGITAGVSNFIYQYNGNIVAADQHIDDQTNTFFMRIEWALDGFTVPRTEITRAFLPLAQRFQMQWSLHVTDETPRVGVFVSKYTHCLYDLLFRYAEGQFKCTIPLIISNHPYARPIAEHFKIPYHEFCKFADNKAGVEAQEMALLKQSQVDLVVLARYKQIFSNDFVSQFPSKMINIHHSFLPAFVGSNPYQQAYRRGVKIIGATSHYVTEELDAGPIIEQDTVRVSHRDSLADLKRKGQDLEKGVLSRAVRWHLEHKILVYNNKTVLFD